MKTVIQRLAAPMALLMLATLVTLVGNLLADLAYAWLDPRVTYK